MYGFNNYPSYGYSNPYLQQYQQPQATQPAQSGNDIRWVQGETGAKAYAIGAGQAVLLMDSEGAHFYIKSADPSGMPLPLRIFDYVERTAQNVPTAPQSTPIDTSAFVTRAEFEERIQAILSDSTVKRTATTKTEGK
jgi:hypothetical protein